MKVLKYFTASAICLVAVSGLMSAASAAPRTGILTPETHSLSPEEVIESDKPITYAVPLDSSSFKALSVPPGEQWLYDFQFWGVTPAGTVKTDTFEVVGGDNVQVNSQADADNYNQASGDYGVTLYKKNWLGIGVSQGQINYPYGSQTVYVGTWWGVGDGSYYVGFKTISSTTSQKIDGEGSIYQNNA
ncbi:hypothetical protein [Paenibacillus arenilitoris]|uniref:Uncharacterized protein n=1 Tax=Paenibacillus arenilitoris TaxID=2772299 RepID=A0A927CPL2_9BACL|nr:hypothetical protein [Paenibacillus arenilitoris]MBD2871389.1 hypothetical protein [Paenibacillus arenilitoris]